METKKRKISIISVALIFILLFAVVGCVIALQNMYEFHGLEEVAERIKHSVHLEWETFVDNVEKYNSNIAIKEIDNGNFYVLRKDNEDEYGEAAIYRDLYNADGVMIESNEIPALDSYWINKGCILEDGSVVLFTYDYIWKYDSNLNLEWEKYLSDEIAYGSYSFTSRDIIVNDNGDYIIVGNYKLQELNNDIWEWFEYSYMAVIDSQGNVKNKYSVRSEENTSIFFDKVMVNGDNIIVFGDISIFVDDGYGGTIFDHQEGLIYNFAEDGTIKWQHQNDSNIAEYIDAIALSDGSYVVLGRNDDGTFVTKYSSNGKVLQQEEINHDYQVTPTKILKLNDERYLVSGNTGSKVIFYLLDENFTKMLEYDYQAEGVKTNLNDMIVNQNYEIIAIGSLENHENKSSIKKGSNTNGLLAKFDITTDLVVTKIWEDRNNQLETRPDSLILQVKDGGKVLAEKTITTKEDMNITFHELPYFTETGSIIQYTIGEVEENKDDLKNYKATIDQANYTITNTFEESIENVPTSDISVWMYVAIAVIACVVIVVIVVIIVKSRKKKNENQ